MEERFIDHQQVWTDKIVTLFSMYNFELKATLELNFIEADTKNWTQDIILHKRILMIPLENEG